MAMYRVIKDKTNPYVMVNKSLVNDPTLSAKAKGIIFYLLSKPDNWQVYEADIVRHFKDGLKAIRAGIRELINQGYIERRQLRLPSGLYSHYEYRVYEYPALSTLPTEVPFSDFRKSDTTNKDLTNTHGQCVGAIKVERDLFNELDRQETLAELHWRAN